MSVANLALIAVMVVIFGLALLLPFPGRNHDDGDAAADPSVGSVSNPALAETGGDAKAAGMWTARIRRRVLDPLTPASCSRTANPRTSPRGSTCSAWPAWPRWASSSSPASPLPSEVPDWWHTDPVGHFFNSLHLWSVEAFMAFMVIHLWGKFWMAAWRGRRAVTWVTGVVAFMASVVECFTGYVSQQNFDSQWISTSGKDAFNAVGVGAFFNVMNFGQMLMWHIVLIPLVLVAIVGAHVLPCGCGGSHTRSRPGGPGPGRAASCRCS